MRRSCTPLGALAVLLLVPWQAAHSQADAAVRALVINGDSAFAAGARAPAIAAYREVVQRDSAASSRVVYRLAVMLAEDGVFPEAIRLHRLYTSLEPNDAEGALGFARTYAWAGQTENALRIYREILAAEPDYRAAALGAGQVLAWAGRYSESVAAHRAWLERRPGDRDAALALARTLAWWGKLNESARLYDSLRMSDADADARKGLALVAAWQGDLVRSERLWRDLARDVPNDAEIWTGLAQVLRWRGQPFDARDALLRALSIDPTHRDARSQRRWLDAELAPVVQARALSVGDSDGNRAEMYIVNGALHPWRDIALRLDVLHVRATDAAAELTSHTARVSATLRLPWGERDWTGRLEIGANHRPNDAAVSGSRTRPVGQVALAGRLSDRASGEVRLARIILDETVGLIASGVQVTAGEVDWNTQLGDRLNVNASLGTARLTGASATNTRLSGVLGVRWIVAHGKSFGIVARTTHHGAEVRDGYFSPRQYVHLEATARARRGRELGWQLSGDAGIGAQRVDYRGQYATHPTQRLTGSVSYVFAPGLEWTAAGTLANVATTSTLSASTYRFGSLSLGGRVPLR